MVETSFFFSYDINMEIIVAPKKTHKSILKAFRKKDPFFDIKLISKNELEKYVFPSVKEEAILYLIKKYHYTYEMCKMFISFLPYINESSDNEKIQFLYKLRKELEDNGYVTYLASNVNPYLKKDVTVIGYSKIDVELNLVLNKLNCHPTYIANGKFHDKPLLFNYVKVEEEVFAVLNQIASLLYEKVDISNIYIFNRDHVYDYYLNKYAPLFGYQINLASEDNYASSGAFKEFRKIFIECGDVDQSLASLKVLMNEDPLYDDLAKLILANVDTSLDVDEQLDYLSNVLKEKKIVKERYDKAIEVISSPIYCENSHIFVLGFVQGNFPRSVKDSDYLTSDEKHLINRNNAKDETKIDEEELLSFFGSNNSFYFSYSEKSLKQGYFPSPLAKTLDLKIVIKNIDDIFYSEETLKYIYSGLKDLDYYYHERGDDFHKADGVVDIDYNTYSNEYKTKVKAFDENSFLSLSTTQLDLFSRCPYHYYLSRVIKLEDNEETSAIRLGKVAHSVFERIHEPNFDFDKAFAEEVGKYQYEKLEELLLKTNLKEQIRIAAEAIILREKYYKNPTIYNEFKLTHNIDDKTVINGVIDNLVTLDDKYFICIDFKTGSATSTTFSEDKLPYGISTQLPTYALLTSEEEKFDGLRIIGVYLNHVITNKLVKKKKEEDLIFDYLKLHGKSINELNAFSYIDSTIGGGKSCFVNGVSIKKDGSMSGSSLVSAEKFEEYKSITSDLYKSMAEKIRNNEFDIKPIYFSDSDEGCAYCPFKDICYRTPKQYNKIEKEKKQEGEEA